MCNRLSFSFSFRSQLTMVSMALPNLNFTPRPRIVASHSQPQNQNQNQNNKNNNRNRKQPTDQINRREMILRSSELGLIGAIFQFSGKKPEYLGVQKNSPALALCPATKNCVSTSENVADLVHYAPPWNYNPPGRKKAVTKQVAMEELLQIIKSTKPDKFTPKIVERKDDYVHIEYQSPILGFVDDVEFWFPPGRDSIVEYRSASRMGNFDFDVNRKRIKALRLELEKKGWSSEDSF